MAQTAILAEQKHKAFTQRKTWGDVLGQHFARLWSLSALDIQPLLLAGGLCVGAAVYFWLPAEPAMTGLCVATAFLAVTLWAAYRWGWSLWIYTPLLMVFGCSLGVTSGAVRTSLVQTPTVTAPIGPVMLEGWVTDIQPGQKGPRLKMKVHAIADMGPDELPKYVRLTHTASLQVAPGRFVRCWAVLRPPPAPELYSDYNFQRQAYFQQLGAVGYVQGRCRGGALGAPADTRSERALTISSFRRNLAAHVNIAAGERAGGFAAALVSGDRSYMPIEDQEALRASGLAHLLAISGLHMSIVGGLVFLLVRRALALIEPLALRVAVQKPAAAAALIASFAYLILSGASVSTQRAFIMAAVVFGAILFDRAAISLRSFAIAMILVILLQPESVVTPGFQMSFAATGALIATYEAWNQRRASSERKMGSFAFSWTSLVVTSVVAAVATAPFALYHFDRLAALGLLANLLAMPIISFFSAPAAALTLILSPFGLGDYGLRLFGYSLELVLMVAHWTRELAPGGWVPSVHMPTVSLVLFSVALGAAMIARGWGRLILSGVPICAAAYFWIVSAPVVLHWSASGDVFVRSDGAAIQRVTFIDGDGLGPLRYSNLETLAECGLSDCLFKYKGVEVYLQPGLDGEGGAIRLANTYGDENTAIDIKWQTIEASGAVTYQLRSDGLHRVPAAMCGNRNWRPCSP